MNKEVEIKTSEKQFFRQYVELIKPFLKITSKRTLDVLSLLLWYNYDKKDIKDLKDRCKLIFDYDIRNEMAKELKITMFALNNQFSILRDKGMIKPLNILDKNILIYPEDEYNLIFKFKITKNGK